MGYWHGVLRLLALVSVLPGLHPASSTPWLEANLTFEGRPHTFRVPFASSSLLQLPQTSLAYCRAIGVPESQPCPDRLGDTILGQAQHQAFLAWLQPAPTDGDNRTSYSLEAWELELAWGHCLGAGGECDLSACLRLLEAALTGSPSVQERAVALFMTHGRPCPAAVGGFGDYGGVLAAIKGRLRMVPVAHAILARPGPLLNESHASQVRPSALATIFTQPSGARLSQ
jgi:hypothetical protein